jgi:hypothetical protein
MLTYTLPASTAGVPGPLGSACFQSSAPSLARSEYTVLPEPSPAR